MNEIGLHNKFESFSLVSKFFTAISYENTAFHLIALLFITCMIVYFSSRFWLKEWDRIKPAFYCNEWNSLTADINQNIDFVLQPNLSSIFT